MSLRASLAAASLLSAMACAAAAPDAIRMSGAQAATSQAPGAQAVSPAMATSATAELMAAGGRRIGSVRFTESARGVLMRVEAKGLPAGVHGIHLHAKGDCSDAKFERAGGHTHEGDGSVHGLLNPAATDTGDLPNVRVAANGALDAELFSSFVTLGGAGDRQPLLDGDGAAILLHAAADDHRSQPIGGSGARIACGVIKPGR